MADHNATIAQSLPTISQSASGETDFFAAKSTLNISEIVGFSYTNTETITATLEERVLYEEVRTIGDVVTVDESVVYYSTIPAAPSVATLDDRHSVIWTTYEYSRPGKVSSSVEFYVDIPVGDVVTISAVATISTTVPVSEQVNVSSSVETSATFVEAVVSTLAVEDTAYGGQGELVVSGLTIDATEEAVLTASQSEGSVLTADDTATYVVSTFEELRADIVIDDRYSAEGSIFNNDETDVITIADRYWARDFAAMAWVLNPETGGVSTYDNFGFESLAVHQGKMYATSPEGIFVLDNDTDEGRFISSSVKTGFLDFTRDETKRLSDFYMSYTGGILELSVETYKGPQEVYTYTVEERELNAPQNNRIKIGKGLSSRYWRFTLENVDGADFQVYDMDAVVGVSNRRL